MIHFEKTHSIISIDVARLARSIVRAVALSSAVVISTGAAIAQVDCRALQAQIARASNGPDARVVRAAAQQRSELARTVNYAQSLGCIRQFPFIGGATPRECSTLNQRISRMQTNLSRLEAAAGGSAGARSALVARFNAYCLNPQQVERTPAPRREVVARQPVAPRTEPRGFFERLFGGGYSSLPIEEPAPEADSPPGETRYSGTMAVCVRKCDGAFFPVSAASGRDPAVMDRFCSAQCPNAQTEVFLMSPSRGIEDATSISGYSYAALPTALRYRKVYDPSCSCRAPGKSWAETLANAESLLSRNQRDLIVTPEKAEELSRPKLRPTQDPRRPANNRAKLAPANAGPPSDESRSADLGLDTGSAGDPGDGRRTVRIIAPTL